MSTDTKTTCPYCGVGCGVIATVADDGKVSVKGDSDHPANFGRLCSKGSALSETLGPEGRLLYPEVLGERTTWDNALDLVANTFRQTIREYGPDSVGFYVSGQLLTEDYYLANKLMKGFIGSANIDTNSRLCMASSVAGHRRAFGSDTVPGTYEDLELADLVVLVGSNLAWCHPVLFQRLASAKRERPAMKIVVIDPRRTMTCDIADLHLPVQADGDMALFSGLLCHLAARGRIEAAFVERHTLGLDDALSAARSLTTADILAATGLARADLLAFYDLFAQTNRVVTCYSQGVNQSSAGTDKVNAIINCHLATGRIGRPGMGPFSLTGQPNAMGGREVGGLANMLAAHMAIENPQHRDLVRRFWKAPAMPERPGLKAVDMFKAVADGRIRALWIMSTNPAVSMPEADAVKAAIAACPFVVVSDIIRDTDTTRLAHVLLPATGWGEKDGTVTNSERRISRQRAFLPAPGEARPDWWQLAEIGRRMGFEDAFDHEGPAEIFAEHAALSALENGGKRDFDIGAYKAIDVDAYEALAPFQWPQPAGQTAGETRFFADGRFYHPDGKARFIAVEAQPPVRVSPDYPWILNTGRVRDHWHTLTRTGRSARLSAHLAEPYVEIHPQDAAGLGIGPADLVEIESPHGAVIVRALLTDRQARGALFVPMHWTDVFAAKARIDSLVPPITDPVSGQPAAKHVAVRARRRAFAAYGFAVAAVEPRTLTNPYWAMARSEGGSRLELAFDEPTEDLEGWCRSQFDLPQTAQCLGYGDRMAGRQTLAFFDAERLLLALYTAKEPVAVSRNWAVSQLQEQHGELRGRLAVIAGRPAAGKPDPGAIVCSCFSVGANQIVAAVTSGCATVEAVGEALSAGTNCGSCRAEIRGIIHGCQVAAAE